MIRSELITIAEIRRREARVLYDRRMYSGAYYLGGYSVECLLKAAIAKQIRRSEFPNKQLASDAYSHKLTDLIKLSVVGIELRKEISSNRAFASNWNIVKDWAVESRYSIYNKNKSDELLNAIDDSANGVFQWIKQFS